MTDESSTQQTPEPNIENGKPPKPETPQDHYWKRQAEKANKERDELAAKLDASAPPEAVDRLNAILDSDIDKELVDYVPENLPAGYENFADFIEKRVKPLQARLAPVGQSFGNPTSPDRTPGPDVGTMLLARFDKLTGKDQQEFFNKYHDVLKPLMNKRGR